LKRKRHPLDFPGSQAAMWLDLFGREFSVIDIVSEARGGQVTIRTPNSDWAYRCGVGEFRAIGPVARALLKTRPC
jgi:hypothetical protein